MEVGGEIKETRYNLNQRPCPFSLWRGLELRLGSSYVSLTATVLESPGYGFCDLVLTPATLGRLP